MAEQNHCKTILLISDNQSDIRKIERLFLDTGSMECKLLRCTTIAAALEQLGKAALAIDIVILDMRLADRGAFEGHYEQLSHASAIPVILLTGDSEEEQAVATPVLAEGAAAHTHRDNLSSLVSTINAVLFPRYEG